jgi:hypothetical protein
MSRTRNPTVAFRRDTPKRILALDGGGLRGILTLGYPRRIEELLRERFGTGKETLLPVSVRTGAAHPAIVGSWPSAPERAQVLCGLRTDSAALVETSMQCMSRIAAARRFLPGHFPPAFDLN